MPASTLTSSIPRGPSSTSPRRSIRALLDPLDALAANSLNLIANHGARFETDEGSYELPRYLFVGPRGGDDPVRIGIFATLHGDEPEGAHALVDFIRLLEASPEIARGYCLFIYPLCNPTGYEDNTRASRRGRDLNREFWRDTDQPEVLLLQQELVTHAFHGTIALHSDDTSHGLYGFVRGATLTKHLLEPALEAASAVLPRNHERVIDGFNASKGIIRTGYEGILSAPPKLRPQPFEITFETPQQAPQYLQQQALVLALHSILTEHRRFISYAANL